MWWRWCCGALVLAVVLLTQPAWGAAEPARTPAMILVDALTGQTLREQDAEVPRPAGSLNQLMVLLLSLEEVDLGALPPDAPITVSSAAATAPGAHIPLRAGAAYLLSDLLKAITLDAANDATIAAAEAIAGSVPACLDLMNARAQRLGMQATRYTNIGATKAAGAPAMDTTTARDQARLALELTRHAQVLQWASLTGLPFDRGGVLLHNINQLLGKVPGVDGMQVSAGGGTGRGASFGAVATAQRGALRLIAIVLDAPDSAARYNAAAELLEWGFAHYERIDVVRKGEPLDLPVRVIDGSVSRLTPVAGDSFSLLRQRDQERNLQIRYQLPAVLTAPLQRNEPIGEVIIEEKGQLVAVVPALSPVKVMSTRMLSAALP
ncbi:MAG: D-alanyl-D-alanine carboxypeptidase family protein [Candidatus Binatia bacterium]